MEIQALLTAPTAPPKPASSPAEAGATEEFAATLKDAELAWEVPPPVPEPAAPTVAPTSDSIPPANYAMALTAMATPVPGPHGVEGLGALPSSPPVEGVIPLDLAKSAPPVSQKLPEAPVPIEISVEVFDVEPIEVPATPVPSAEFDAEVIAEIAAESPPSENEEAPEEAPPDQSSSETIEPRATEGRSESRLEAAQIRRAEAARPEVRLDTHNVVRELANRIELMAAAKSQQGVIVHLQPLDLGSITLLVKPESGGVSAQIGASNDQVRQALEQSQPTLARQLEQRGLTVTSVSVSAETTNRDPQRSPQQQQAFDSRQFQHQTASHRAPTYGSPDPVARRARLVASGVDLWI